jgi:hypothetical protein
MSEAAFAQALANVQAAMPKVGKSNTATVPTKAGGSYTYKYADLADIFEKVMPLLAANGLAWIATPTLSHGDAFVLRYALLHKDGHRETGEYPLPHPSSGKAQDIGSAITYARRYSFCAQVGVATDEDDDGRASAQHLPRPRQAPRPVVDGSAASLQVPPATFPPTFPTRSAHLDETTGELTSPTPARSSTHGFENPKVAEWVNTDGSTIYSTGAESVPDEWATPIRTDDRVWCSPGQQKLMGIAYTNAGIKDRAERLADVARIVGHDVTSAKELTVAEASHVIDDVKGRVTA